MEDVDLILGNNLAGNLVWRAVVPPVVKTVPSLSAEANESEQDFPDVFVSYTATRAMSAEKKILSRIKRNWKNFPLPICRCFLRRFPVLS